MVSQAGASPALHRHRLGQALRELREARGLRLEDVALILDVAASTLSRIETGDAPTRAGYLTILLDEYGVTEPDQRQHLAALAREGQKASWWADWKGLIPPGAGRYLDLEATASHVSAYRTQVIPGLLQTPCYARAVISIRRPELTPGQVNGLLALQQHRQEMYRQNEAVLHVILDESALRRTIGSADVMAAQLERLLDLMSLPTLRLQVVGLDKPCSLLSQPFTVFGFAGTVGATIACRIGGDGQIGFSRNSLDAASAQGALESFSSSALSCTDSADLIKALISLRSAGCVLPH